MRKFALRVVIASLGIVAIVWAIVAARAYSKDALLADTAKAILSGDKFNPKQVESIKRRVATPTADLNEASALSGAAIMRMFLLEEQLKSGNHELSVSDYDQLQTNVGDALARSPTDSFMWLAAFWLKRLRFQPAVSDLNLLRMSYWSGPNEGWIAIKRIPLALGTFGSLPPDLAEQALQDFVGLVRSGFIRQAAGVLEGPGAAMRNQLAGKLLTVDTVYRQALARELEEKDIEGVVIPGIEKQKPRRPF